MGLPRPVRVVGVGSPQGDDAVGWEIIRQLRQRGMEQNGVELHVAEGGQRLLDRLDGQGSLIILDAVCGDRPGTVHRLEWPDARLEMLRPGSTHGVRPTEALRLAGVLGVLPTRVVIFGIEGTAWGTENGLSAIVATAVPVVIACIGEELASA